MLYEHNCQKYAILQALPMPILYSYSLLLGSIHGLYNWLEYFDRGRSPGLINSYRSINLCNDLYKKVIIVFVVFFLNKSRSNDIEVITL